MSSVAQTRTKGGARIMAVLALVILGAVAWMVGPMFLPVYRWTEVRFQEIADKHGISVDELSKPQEMEFRFMPRDRSRKDPLPWQMLVRTREQTPSWVKDKDGKKVNEWQTLVRVDLVSDRTGEAPGSLFIGSMPQDWYFTARCWRLPPKSLGRTHTRPVVLYDAWTWDRMEIGNAKVLHENLEAKLKDPENGWITDDDSAAFPDRKDPFTP